MSEDPKVDHKARQKVPLMRDCEDCGEEIPAERLKVLPSVKVCIWCKRADELARKKIAS